MNNFPSREYKKKKLTAPSMSEPPLPFPVSNPPPSSEAKHGVGFARIWKPLFSSLSLSCQLPPEICLSWCCCSPKKRGKRNTGCVRKNEVTLLMLYCIYAYYTYSKVFCWTYVVASYIKFLWQSLPYTSSRVLYCCERSTSSSNSVKLSAPPCMK